MLSENNCCTDHLGKVNNKMHINQSYWLLTRFSWVNGYVRKHAKLYDKKKRSSIDTVIINSVELLTTQSRDLHYILTRYTCVIKNVHIVFKLIQLNKIVKEPVFFVTYQEYIWYGVLAIWLRHRCLYVSAKKIKNRLVNWTR